MKQIRYLPFLLCFFIACKKNHPDPNIVGKWEWVRSTGGLAGVTITPQSSGKTWQLRLNDDFTCIQTGDFMSEGSGVYTLTREMNGSSTVNSLNITFTQGGVGFKYNYYFENDTLRLDQAAMDGFYNYFVRGL